jgi:hypothetical protein
LVLRKRPCTGQVGIGGPHTPPWPGEVSAADDPARRTVVRVEGVHFFGRVAMGGGAGAASITLQWLREPLLKAVRPLIRPG